MEFGALALTEIQSSERGIGWRRDVQPAEWHTLKSAAYVHRNAALASCATTDTAQAVGYLQ